MTLNGEKIGIWQNEEAAAATAFGGFFPGDIKVRDLLTVDSDGDGVVENFFDLFRHRVGGDVVIARLAAQQEVPHATANPECREARFL